MDALVTEAEVSGTVTLSASKSYPQSCSTLYPFRTRSTPSSVSHGSPFGRTLVFRLESSGLFPGELPAHKQTNALDRSIWRLEGPSSAVCPSFVGFSDNKETSGQLDAG